jgi:hypothetical protein
LSVVLCLYRFVLIFLTVIVFGFGGRGPMFFGKRRFGALFYGFFNGRFRLQILHTSTLSFHCGCIAK